MSTANDKAAAGQALRSAVREQMAADDPPEVRRTFDRLMGRGLTEDQTIEFMAAVLAAEMFEMLKTMKPYDRDHYENALRALPQMPWEA